MRHQIYCALLLFTLTALSACGEGGGLPPGVARVEAVSPQERITRAYVEAFSARDVDAMLAMCTEDIRWGYVEGAAYSEAGMGKAALRDELQGYFGAVPTVTSEIVSMMATGDSVAITEQVSWVPEGQSDPKTSKALGVYQFRDRKIAAVWYFPRED
ncbi:MAG: nuclear transport factor 2 family protein [Pseudomonadota bacterium]